MSNIVEVASSMPDKFSTLVAAVQAAGLVETLSGTGPFTVFAPTNEAFESALTALNMTPEALLGNKDLLTKVLTYHVVPGKVMAADVMGMASPSMVKTVQGSEVSITHSEEGVMVDGAKVTMADVAADNGVIHVIDAVIMPK